MKRKIIIASVLVLGAFITFILLYLHFSAGWMYSFIT